MNYETLDACVRKLRPEMIDFTTELVGIASENPPGAAYPECVRAIESRLRALDMPCEIIRYRPDRCVFTVDRRMNPEEDYEEAREALFAVFDDVRRDGVKLEVEVFQEGRPSGTPQATALGRALSSHVRAVTGKTPQFEMCPGLLEIRFYAEQRMPAYAYGPGLLTISHGPKEFVDTNRIVECAMIYARVAATLLRARPDAPSPSR